MIKENLGICIETSTKKQEFALYDYCAGEITECIFNEHKPFCEMEDNQETDDMFNHIEKIIDNVIENEIFKTQNLQNTQLTIKLFEYAEDYDSLYQLVS